MHTKELRVVIFSIIMMLALCCGVSAKDRTGKRGVAMKHSVVNFNQIATQSLLSAVPYVAPINKHMTLPIPQNLPLRAGATFSENPRVAGVFAPPLSGPSPATADNFLALGDNNTSIPPDTHGAVGLNDLMVTLNTQVRIQSKTGEVKTTVPLDDFWSSVGPFDAEGGVFDPKVLYDPYNDRWMFTACADAKLETSSVLIGVSQTSDPSGEWNLYRFDADDANLVFADYPSMGFNNKWIVVQFNMYTVEKDEFSTSHIYVFDKADLYAGGEGLHTVINDDQIGGCQVPAITYDPDLDYIYLVQSWNGNSYGYWGELVIYRIGGAVGDPSMIDCGWPYTQSTWGTFGAAGGFAPQYGSTEKIMTNDDRMQNVVYRNNSLWCTHTVFLPADRPTRSAVQWWEVTPYGHVVQNGRVDDSKGINFYAFPSIAVNKMGDALVGFSKFSANQYASANYAFRFGTDPVDTLRNPTILKQGEAPYAKAATAGYNRWGDYSNTIVDPVNDLDMWTIQEYAASPVENVDRWGTWWGKLQMTFVISGKIMAEDGTPIPDVKLVGLPGTPLTDADGVYSVVVGLDWSCTTPIKPTKEYYLFTPMNIIYTKVAADYLNQDYEGSFDNIQPTITNITSSNPNKWYTTNETINVQVSFDEPVVVTGVPKLQLEMGTVDQWASCTSGSGTDTLTFTYKVKAGDTSSDLDYTCSSAITLNGGRIKDAHGNAANLLLPEPGTDGSLSANKDIKVNTNKPTLGTVTPNTGSLTIGQWTTVKSSYLDPDGACNIADCYLLINESTISLGAAQFIYNQSQNKISMIDDAGTIVSEGIAPGCSGIIETENAKIDCRATSVTQNENTVTVNWRIMLKPTLAKKTCNLYLKASDDSGASVAWASKGTVFMNSMPIIDAVSPNTGSVKSGNWTVFTCTYSDYDGAADLSTCSLLINSILNNPKGGHFFYNHNQRRLFMKNNIGTVIPTGGVLAGGASMIESENAVLDCAGTTITSSGTTVTIAWRVKLKTSMQNRTCNVYATAKDDVEATAGWVTMGQVNVMGNSAPGLGTVTPNAGAVTVGEWQTFTAVYTDVDGYANTATCGMLINNFLSSKGGAYFYYDENLNKFFMKSNAGVFIGGQSPGSMSTIESENAILDCGTCVVSKFENTVSITWSVMLKSTMAKKTCNIYALTTDDGAASTGWLNKGHVYVNTAPSVSVVSPNAGVAPKEQWVRLTSTYTDIDGAGNIAICDLLANNIVSNVGAAHFIYNRTSNKLFMHNNNSATIGGIAPGAAGILQSENALLDCAGSSVVTSGNTITISWRIKLKTIMSGKTCGLYSSVIDTYGAKQDWTSKGTVYVNSTPQTVSVMPEAASVPINTWTNLLADYSDLDGAVNLGTIGLLVNNILGNKAGAHVFYDENENKLFMKNNLGTIIGGVSPGSEEMIESENAVLDCAGTTVMQAGCNIVVNFRLKFKTPMVGKTCSMYMLAIDDSGAKQPWISKGNLTITPLQ